MSDEPVFLWEDGKLIRSQTEAEGFRYALTDRERDPRLPDHVWFEREGGRPSRVWMYREAWTHFGEPQAIRLATRQGPLGRMIVLTTATDPDPRPHDVITDMYGRKRRIPLDLADRS